MQEEWQDILMQMQALTKNDSQVGTTTKGLNNECPKCHGTGWIYFREDGLDYAKECDCNLLEFQRERNKLRFASIPEIYRNVTFKDIKTGKYSSDGKLVIKSIYKSVKYWLENILLMEEKCRGLYLWSHTKGSGKSMMACVIANELMAMGKTVKFATSMDIINEIKASWDKESGISESRLLRDLADTEYLIIDDFGTEKARDWIGEKFYQIINKRYIDMRITLFTSNFDIRELPYDDRVSNRIMERCFNIHFPEESIREMIAKTDNVRMIEENNG